MNKRLFKSFQTFKPFETFPLKDPCCKFKVLGT